MPSLEMRPPLLVVTLLFFSACGTVVARFDDNIISFLFSRQSVTTRDCNATCSAFKTEVELCRNTPHCGCRVPFLKAQGDCALCQVDTYEDAASVQLQQDVDIRQCHSEGIKVDFQLQLPPEAEAIVQSFDRKSEQLRQQQKAFLALQIAGGHIGIVLLLLFGVFSHKVHHHPTFFNFCITWVFSSIFYSILLYYPITEDHRIAIPFGEVDTKACQAQAALVDGVQILTACSTMSLVIQLWLNLRTAIYHDLSLGPRQTRWTTVVLLMAPYILFLSFFLPALLIGIRDKYNDVSFELDGVSGDSLTSHAIPGNFYCTVNLNSFVRVVYGVTLGFLIVTLVFDVFIICLLYNNWRAFRHVQRKNAISLSTLLRIMVFSTYRAVIAVAFGVVLGNPTTIPALSRSSVPVWVDMLQASIPLVGTLVLGINRDLISALTVKFWRRKTSATDLNV